MNTRKLYRNVSAFVVAGTLAVTAFSSATMRAADNPVVAKVGDTEMKADELRALLKGLEPAEQAALSRDPALLSRTVRALLLQRMVLEEALAKKWDSDPAVLARLARLRDAALVETYLDSVSAPPASYPAEAEVKAAYDANRAAFVVPRQYHLAQIFIAGPKSPNQNETDKAQARLDAVVKEVRRPEADFALVAKAQSDEHESASRGGEIGWLAENRVQPEIRLRIIGQTKDVTTEPIRLQDGWHIVKILDVKDAYTASLAEVHDQLVATMRAERAKVERQNYVARILQKSPLSLNELAISTALEKSGK